MNTQKNDDQSTIMAELSSQTSDPLPDLHLFNGLLDVTRLPQHVEKYYEIKDPSVVQLPDQSFMMYASIGNSVRQEWIVGRFASLHPAGPWIEISPVKFVNLSGPQLCAPAVTLEENNGQLLYKMYIQTACFEENGIIALATSEDGETFTGEPHVLASRSSLAESHQTDVIGVYDVGVSEVKKDDEELLCMLFSGYRRVGCGDLYVSYRQKHAAETDWTPAQRLLAQEEVPFHNHPDYEHFEWGLEGAKLVQLREDCFLLIGVCFLPKPDGFLGTRQRVFFAAANSINGPFTPICTPFMPYEKGGKQGENGHPDTLVLGQDLWVIYQERYGEGEAWHLRSARFDITELSQFLSASLKNQVKATAAQVKPDFEHNYNADYLQHGQA